MAERIGSQTFRHGINDAIILVDEKRSMTSEDEITEELDDTITSSSELAGDQFDDTLASGTRDDGPHTPTVSTKTVLSRSVSSGKKDYRDDDEENTFGISKKDVYYPCSDFKFTLQAEVICEVASSSGYLVTLTPRNSSDTRWCYFTAESTNKKSDFMKCLNSSYKSACLQCSFSDKELAEYIQFKKRATPLLMRKYAVEKVGMQSDRIWVLSSNIHLSPSGQEISVEDSSYIWIGHVFNGPGIAKRTDECTIELPLTTDPLCSLMSMLKQHFKHNFFPCLLTMSASVLALHYKMMIKKLKSCPVPLAFGESGTGKTTALLCGLALFGAQDSHFFSKVTREKVMQLCASSSIPVGIDDPQSKTEMSRLIIDLYNGATSGTVSQGSMKPNSTCIISANFTTVEQQRYASRCLMIEFVSPPLSLTLTEYMELVELWEKTSSCAGFAISLGDKFFSEGVKCVDTELMPQLANCVGSGVIPRVLPLYSILYWFSLQFLKETKMQHLENELVEYFSTKVLGCALRLQSSSVIAEPMAVYTIDMFGDEFLECIQKLPRAQVATFFRTGLKYCKKPAFGILLDKVPSLSQQAKVCIRNFIKDKKMGVYNNPRPFSTPGLAAQGIIPTEFSSLKAVKCTVILEESFSEVFLKRLLQELHEDSSVGRSPHLGGEDSQVQQDFLKATTRAALLPCDDCDDPASASPIPAPKGDSSVAVSPIPLPDEEGLAAVSPIPVPDDNGSVGVTPIPVPDDNGSVAVTPIPVPDDNGSVAVTPIPVPDDNGSVAVTPIPVPDDNGSVAVTPIPVPDDNGSVAVTPIPVPDDNGSVAVTPIPLPDDNEPYGSVAVTPIPASADQELKKFTRRNKVNSQNKRKFDDEVSLPSTQKRIRKKPDRYCK